MKFGSRQVSSKSFLPDLVSSERSDWTVSSEWSESDPVCSERSGPHPAYIQMSDPNPVSNLNPDPIQNGRDPKLWVKFEL